MGYRPTKYGNDIGQLLANCEEKMPGTLLESMYSSGDGFHIDKIMDRFGNRKIRTLNVAMDDATKRLVIRESKKAGISMSQYVRMCITYFNDSQNSR